MVEYEASTCWEMYPSYNLYRANPNFLTRSHCHAWSAGPGYFLGADILGVRKAEPGWKRVVVAPQPTGLAWARGSVPLPDAGRIDVAWRVEGSNGGSAGEDSNGNGVPRLHVTVRAPEGLDVEVRFPDGFAGTYERTAL
jgi:hypothetical protein